jgi:prepilin-type N-terminal cleavage/methylation domain-containing protein
MEKKRAFTLIELLVVIAIIALLLSVLIPALNAAKKQAAAAVCLSNLNGLSKGWHLYTGDNDDRLMNGHAPRDPAYRDRATWVNAQRGYLDIAWWANPPHDVAGTFTGDHPPVCSLEDEERGISSGVLFPYIENPDAYHCPASRHYLTQDANRRGGKRSYSITGLMNGEIAYWVTPDRQNQPAGGWTVATKITDIRSPGDKIVFVEDIDGRGWNMGSWVIWGNGWTDALAIFHIDRGTLGFADGHAEKHRWVDESTIYNGEHIMDSNFTIRQPNTAAGEGEDYEFMRRAYVPMS